MDVLNSMQKALLVASALVATACTSVAPPQPRWLADVFVARKYQPLKRSCLMRPQTLLVFADTDEFSLRLSCALRAESARQVIVRLPTRTSRLLISERLAVFLRVAAGSDLSGNVYECFDAHQDFLPPPAVVRVSGPPWSIYRNYETYAPARLFNAELRVDAHEALYSVRFFRGELQAKLHCQTTRITD